MSRSHLIINRAALSGACALVLALAAPLAWGETSEQPRVKKDSRACGAVYKSAQEREKAGHLVEATKLFLKCSGICGGTVAQECASKNISLFSRIPTVVVLASDSTGEPLVDVEVKIDGEPLTSHLDGLALPVDPGTHEFTFTAGTAVFPPQKITIVGGERNRPVSVSQEPGKQRDQPVTLSASVTDSQR